MHSVKSSQTQTPRLSGSFKVLCWLVYVICRLLQATWRVRYIGADCKRMALQQSESQSYVLACFHENSMMGLLAHKNEGVAVMVSRSKDGAMVAFVIDRIGLRSVRGSSSRGGREARDEMIQTLKTGVCGAITVDGPRGPRREPKRGIADIAHQAGAAIIPLSCFAESCWVLSKTWDHTRIPKPFSRILIHYDEPFWLHGELEMPEFEAGILRVKHRLNSCDEMLSARFDELWQKAKS